MVTMNAAEVVLDAGGREVTIERSRLIISTARPDRWSVVALPGDAVNVPAQWGLHYAVCPACAHRAPLGSPTPSKRCSRCGDSFPLEGEEP